MLFALIFSKSVIVKVGPTFFMSINSDIKAFKTALGCL